MSFIVLDVEIIFLYPFTDRAHAVSAGFGLVAMAVFVLVLLVPFAYLLSTGAVSLGPGARGDRAARRTGGSCGPAAVPGRDGLDPARPDDAEAA